jgi:ribose/xylose/arabinose/galactoside ABC-type transport system permease subunit
MPKRIEAILLFVLGTEIATFSTIAQNFFTVDNTFDVIRTSVEIGRVAIALTPMLATARIDPTVGSIRRDIRRTIILAAAGLTTTRRPQHA